MKKTLAKTIFKITGWTYHADPNLLEKKQVIIGFEHTSNWDGILAVALFAALGINVRALVKKELFKGPLKNFLLKMGAIPVDRNSKQDVVTQMVEHFNAHEEFSLAIAPEATRAKDGQTRGAIKTGFWHIAKAANVPIILMYAQAPKKTGGLIGKIYPSNLQDDLKTIQAKYAEYGIDIKIPE